MSNEKINFSGKDIDDVLRALSKKENVAMYAYDFQKKCLPDWQVLKVESIFKYLYENYEHRFSHSGYSDSFGYFLQYSSEYWEEDLAKGGFEKYWKHKESLKDSIRSIMKDAQIGSSLTLSVLKMIDKFF